ncbi:MAG: right-handed parallel beta-helix repeat-containing protein [Verrucomicrobia bacterium]|nr:right-handed parallel beta-helix repeat-containing protein [Verrucomicrobiota bacterium]
MAQVTRWALGALMSAGLLHAGESTLPRVRVIADDARITRSCLIEIPPGTIIPDLNGNGVLLIAAPDITVRFAPGSVLRGAPADRPGSDLAGVGIRIEGHPGVTIGDARVHGFKCGLWASQTDGLTLDGGDYSDNYRQRLRSTPAAEEGADWLFPHRNDERKWRDEYGAAIAVESSHRVTVRDLRVRRGQNGILFDRVNESRVYDNDCSFLSGWGLALWRSSRNLISRNAFDFCVRGHVEGVYNRGQDSAGILCFEQCNDNLFLENSATHGGDGFFGFAGREALGEPWVEQERERLRTETGRQEVDELIQIPPDVASRHEGLGCNRNLFLGNDFSYASAHGLELTFSRGNRIIGNRLVENAICGIWGGYSSDTLIASNRIEGNGGMAYGLERGGVNMEHAAGNLIISNRFLNNRCAIHLWWDNDAGLFLTPGVYARNRGVSGNLIAGNQIIINPRHPFGSLRPEELLIGLQLRVQSGRHVTNNAYFDNRVYLDLSQAREWLVDPGCEPIRSGQIPSLTPPEVQPLGQRRPVGARAQLRGRHQIIMDEWGPWDHASPLIRPGRREPGSQIYDLFGFESPPTVRVVSGSVRTETDFTGPTGQLRVIAPPGVHPFRIELESGQVRRELSATLMSARWEATFFAWSVDPREDLAGWRSQAMQPGAQTVRLDRLDFSYGWGGPGQLKLIPDPIGHGPGVDRFGMIARARLELPAGRWRFSTLSDDGVRVRLDERTVIENWTWHGPTRDAAEFEQRESREVEVTVEHFEIDGYAVLRFDLEPAEPRDP